MAHTPGPWRLWLSPNEPGVFTLHGASRGPQGRDLTIARRNSGTPNGAEGIANARLLAAAPDLLAGLKVMEETVMRLGLARDQGDDVWAAAVGAQFAALRQARAAIAKAEGAQ